MIAVLVNGVIAWSWHIWITEDDLKSTVISPNGKGLAPKNLGFCLGRTDVWNERSCEIKATQEDSGETLQITVTQSASTYEIKASNNTYQWGRKDPLMAPNGNNVWRKYYSDNGKKPSVITGDRITLSGSIQVPYPTYWVNEGGEWCSTYSSDRWNANYKTIYDPSPVGYKVPNQGVLSGFGGKIVWVDGSDGINGYLYTDSNEKTLLLVAGGECGKAPISFGDAGRYWTSSNTHYRLNGDGVCMSYDLTFSKTQNPYNNFKALKVGNAVLPTVDD